MASLFDSMTAGGMDALRTVHGDTATYKAGGTGTDTTITVIMSESPMMVIGDDQGQAEDRTILLHVQTDDVAVPKRGDTYTISAIAYAGVWTQQKVQSRNNVAWIIECKRIKHNELGANGVREAKS